MILLGLILHGVAAAPAWSGYDAGKYLPAGIRVELAADGRPKIFPGGTRTKYWGVDTEGRRGKLRLASPSELSSELVFTAVADALGVPYVPVYPVDLALEGTTLNATFEPFVELADPEEYLRTHATDALTRARMAEVRLLGYLFGIFDLDNDELNVGFVEGRYVAVDVGAAFDDYVRELQEAANPGIAAAQIDAFLKGWPTRTADLDETGRRDYLRELNRFLTQLERLPEAGLRELLLPILAAKGGAGLFAEFLRRRSAMRSYVVKYLDKKRYDWIDHQRVAAEGALEAALIDGLETPDGSEAPVLHFSRCELLLRGLAPNHSAR